MENSSIKERILECMKLGDYQLVANMSKEALRLYPDDIEVIKNIAFAFSMPEVGKEDEAIYLLKEKISQHQDSFELHSTLANCYIMAEDNQNAYKELKKAIEINPRNSDVYSLLATVITTSDDIEPNINEAIDALNKAIILSKDNWRYYHSLGIINWKISNMSEAKRLFKIALNKISCSEEHFIKQMENWIKAINQKETFWDANQI